MENVNVYGINLEITGLFKETQMFEERPQTFEMMAGRRGGLPDEL